MPDLSDLLAAEARRQEPAVQPPFEDLLRVRADRDRRRHRVVAGVVLLLAVGGAALVPAVLDARRSPNGPVVASPGQEATVTGVLRVSGTLVPAKHPGIPGVVVFESATGHRSTAKASTDGTFTISVEPGTYTVTGTSPQFDDGRAVCRTPDRVTVGPTGFAGVIVECNQLAPVTRTGSTSPPADTVTARLTLSATSLRSGAFLRARITIDNTSGKDIHLIGCGSIYAVVLVGEGHKPTPSWPLCARPITIPVGETTYPVTVAASYIECSAKGGQGMATCNPDGSMPGLPPGRYTATTWGVTESVPVPAPVAVIVTP